MSDLPDSDGELAPYLAMTDAELADLAWVRARELIDALESDPHPRPAAAQLAALLTVMATRLRA
ncbi:MAG: hypothetical protein ACHQNA_14965, partial [Acidimicrobiales bacterium]